MEIIILYQIACIFLLVFLLIFGVLLEHSPSNVRKWSSIGTIIEQRKKVYWVEYSGQDGILKRRPLKNKAKYNIGSKVLLNIVEADEEIWDIKVIKEVTK
jgi:hypothetical protein